MVESPGPGATVMEMRMEHFVAVSVCVITVLLLLLVIISVLLVQSARRHLCSTRQVNETHAFVLEYEKNKTFGKIYKYLYVYLQSIKETHL